MSIKIDPVWDKYGYFCNRLWVAAQSACEAHSHSQGLNYELAFMSEPD